MTPEAYGVLGCLLLLVLLVASMPVAFAMALVGALGIWALSGLPAAMYTLSSELFSTFGNGGFTVIPLFVLMDHDLPDKETQCPDK